MRDHRLSCFFNIIDPNVYIKKQGETTHCFYIKVQIRYNVYVVVRLIESERRVNER